MQIAILGLGRMGSRILNKLLEGGHEVVAWNRSKDVSDKLKIDKSEYIVKGKLQIGYGIESVYSALRHPRVFWLMLPAGEATDTIFNEIMALAQPEDIIIDGGNANYKDTQKRFETLAPKGIKFLGIGVSGGVHADESGFCLMAGGDKSAYDYLSPAFDSLAAPEGGHAYFGTGGAGHFVKMVHNGIEYGMMQAIGEGFGVLYKSPYQINLQDSAYLWQRGSIIRSFLLDMSAAALQEDPTLASIEGYIAASGEGKWTVEAGRELKVPVEVIEKSLQFREKSQYDKVTRDTAAAKLVAAMRNQFGGHEVKKVESEK